MNAIQGDNFSKRRLRMWRADHSFDPILLRSSTEAEDNSPDGDQYQNEDDCSNASVLQHYIGVELIDPVGIALARLQPA